MSTQEIEKIKLSFELKELIRQQKDILQRQIYLFRVNRRHWNTVYKESKINPLPDKDYKTITTRIMLKEKKQILPNIKFLAASIISARYQLQEIEN